MRIEQLQYLDAVVRTGSMRSATEMLHLSQPALSESLANLERELGVTLLDRARTGARVSEAGRELLPFVGEVLDGIDRLRAAAREQGHSGRVVRLGTVNSATVPLLAPAIRAFGRGLPGVQVEVINARQDQIDQLLREGGLDLGLINRMSGDDPAAPEFEATELLHSRPVVCFPTGSAIGSELAAYDAVPIGVLAQYPLVAMRPGYLMNRFLRRELDGVEVTPDIACYVDGAEIGKIMVAENAGITVLPEYSVAGDPLHRGGFVSYRPIASDNTRVSLQLQMLRARFRSTSVATMATALADVAAGLRLAHGPDAEVLADVRA